MAEVIFGVYGFDFSVPVTVVDADLVPLYRFPESERRATDRAALVLTGYGVFPTERPASWSDQLAFVRRLADGMTFCQQQLVMVTRLIRISPGDTVQAMIDSGRLPSSLPLLTDRHSFGPAIGNDSLFPQSRARFLETFLAQCKQASATDPLIAAIYRQIEVWRLFQPYVELEHYLLYSGLEILAREFGPNPDNKNVAVPMAGFLKSHGFDVSQRMAEDWAAARNALFHRGHLESIAPGSRNIVRITDHLYTLSTLLADASLKQLRFDDGHINWSRWHDRQPFV